ncbi:hypothetical protein SSP24_23660 [Streptomyces spinoverrucosus]|uniref:Uncharacterized protein n=1 Tax=Streptomyces spinoverrucosus TaxID=284043 RepID=A0A4Y3VGH2_9ACTN|nr:hypothetical protein [Streptomyces spinoverrucosus]GEC04711.1 hypothetical protein SSP24_23660 [Streptomyces spinoverrucosus]GHB59105.1 hypothetical protein GCM10010397_31500 [Streptomyces spinoverrucosus]
MADNRTKNEFTFVVTGVELTEEQQERVSRAIAQAGALALGDLAPADATPVRLSGKIWWTGQPKPNLMRELQEYAAAEAGYQR